MRLQNVSVVDVVAGTVLRRRQVTIAGDAIAAVGMAADSESGESGHAELFVAPGLIDTHAHFFLDAGGDPRASFLASDAAGRWRCAVNNAAVAISAGIATVRDCAAPTPGIYEPRRQEPSPDPTSRPAGWR